MNLIKRKHLTIQGMVILSCFGFVACDKADDVENPKPEICPEWSLVDCPDFSKASHMSLRDQGSTMVWTVVYAGELTITETSTYEASGLLKTYETSYKYVREAAADSAWTNFWEPVYGENARREGNTLIRDNMSSFSDEELKKYYTRWMFQSIYDYYYTLWSSEVLKRDHMWN